MIHICRVLLGAMLAFSATLAIGQVNGNTGTFPENSSADEVRSYFESRLKRLGDKPDYANSLALYKAWNAALPKEKGPKEKLLLLLADSKQYDAVVTFNQPHFDAPDERFSRQLMSALGLYFAGRDDEVWARAEKLVSETRKQHIPSYARSSNPGWSPFRAVSAELGLAGALELQARVLIRKGSYRQALSIAESGIDAVDVTLDIVKVMPPNEVAAAATFQTKETLANLLLQKIRAQVANGSNWQAMRTLEEYLPLSREVESHPRYFWNLAISEYNERNFSQAEVYFRKADAAAQKMGAPNLSLFRSDCAQGIVGSLEGQNKWNEVTTELERLDTLAGEDPTLMNRIRYRFERSYAYVRTGARLDQALELLQELNDTATDGMFTAHARGLRGVVLWQQNSDPAKALTLLKAAVEVYMTPLYFDDQAVGLNADVRDLVIETYLEATFQTAGEDAMKALGPAEWVRNSSVQSALMDAAVRFAANDSALSELVRKDQDLKNEIRNLRGKASVELEASVNAQIADLTIQRAEIQAVIKSEFPEYDKLVAATPPDVSAAVRHLFPDEALVLLMPTDKSVFVWALTGDGKSTAVRVAMSKGEIVKLVKDLRSTLNFSDMNGYLKPFNTSAASAIYQNFLAPLHTSFAGKKHLIIAAGGALGQIPFGVLLSEPENAANGEVPFLIKQYAISHVPSLGAWLAVKQYSESSRASESLIAWGDPSFGSDVLASRAPPISVRRLSLTRSQPQYVGEGLTTKGGLRYSDIPPLPETRDELMAIASALKANPTVDLHLGTEASKSNVLRSNATGELARKKVVVFATHGLMAGDLPNLTQPALALANTEGNGQDPLANLLTLDEVLGLKLNADWVVLSACNTAAADGRVEESMSGLARGFFYAGSRSLLVTHWAVETESAKLLTTNTFLNYSANPLGRKAENLRQAMLTVMGIPAYTHPAYWGPYALVGDGGR